MYNSYMFNDKLHVFTYKNTIYQSKLKLLAIFGQCQFYCTIFRQKTFSSTNRFRACAVHHTEGELSWLIWIIVAQTQIACEHVFPEIFRENHFSVFLAVLDEFLLTSILVWSKKIWQNRRQCPFNEDDATLYTTFQLYRGNELYCWGNRRNRRKSPTCRKSLTNFIT